MQGPGLGRTRHKRCALLLVLATGLVVATAACARGSKRLEGTWRGTRTNGVEGQVQSSADRWATQLQMEFKGERLTVTTGYATSSSRYRVVRENKGSIVIVTEAERTEETLSFEDDTTIVWTVQNGKTVTLAKQ